MNDGSRVGLDYDVLVPEHLASPAPELSHMDLADALADPARSRALVCWNMNVAASAPRQRDVLRALAREDLFTLVVDPFPTDTARYADVVLPAATFLEHDDVVVPYFDLGLSAQVQAVEAAGEALPNSEIFRRLARAMGYDDPALHEPDADILERFVAGSGLVRDLAELRERATVYPDGAPFLQFADGDFATPSGRIELASDAAAADGHPRTAVPHADERPRDGQLRLLSPGSEWTMNASFANDRKVRRRLGPATVTLHPAEAGRLGLTAGEQVRVTSDEGSLLVELAIGDEVPEGVALIPKGRWPSQEPGGVNVNVLTIARRTDMGESTAIHGTLVRIEQAG
jgi:anaerobic selenocysteine-containing dehydrogenase